MGNRCTSCTGRMSQNLWYDINKETIKSYYVSSTSPFVTCNLLNQSQCGNKMLLLIYHDRNHKYAHTLYVTTPQPTNVKSLIFMLHQNIAHCSSIPFEVRMKIYRGVGVLQIANLLTCTFVLKFCKCTFSNGSKFYYYNFCKRVSSRFGITLRMTKQSILSHSLHSFQRH